MFKNHSILLFYHISYQNKVWNFFGSLRSRFQHSLIHEDEAIASFASYFDRRHLHVLFSTDITNKRNIENEKYFYLILYAW